MFDREREETFMVSYKITKFMSAEFENVPIHAFFIRKILNL